VQANFLRYHLADRPSHQAALKPAECEPCEGQTLDGALLDIGILAGNFVSPEYEAPLAHRIGRLLCPVREARLGRAHTWPRTADSAAFPLLVCSSFTWKRLLGRWIALPHRVDVLPLEHWLEPHSHACPMNPSAYFCFESVKGTA
jgi:hypothetical protein